MYDIGAGVVKYSQWLIQRRYTIDNMALEFNELQVSLVSNPQCRGWRDIGAGCGGNYRRCFQLTPRVERQSTKSLSDLGILESSLIELSHALSGLSSRSSCLVPGAEPMYMVTRNQRPIFDAVLLISKISGAYRDVLTI
jgi:hypothetical protein